MLITMKKLILLGLIVFTISMVFSQKILTISSRDKTDKYTNILLLAPSADKKYMKDYTIIDSSKIVNKNFVFHVKAINDNFPRPYKFGIIIKKNESYINTGIFFIDNKNQTILFDSKTGTIEYSKKNTLYEDVISNKLFFKKLKEEKATIKNKYYDLIINNKNFPDSLSALKIKLNRIENDEDQLYLNYVTNNSKSYVLFWNLVEKTKENNRYKPIYETIFKKFNLSIRNSNAGEIYLNDLLELKNFEIGRTFPLKKINEVDLFKFSGKQYTLVDFWFSYCTPCIIAIPKYKELYKKYKDKDFEIVGVSTDRTQDISNWRKVIENNDLVWKNILDENGVEAKKYNINQFPTTFLLDAEGKIIKKNISPEELEQFLEENLKN